MRFFDYLWNRWVFARHKVEYAAFPVINGRVRVAKFSTGGKIRLGRNVVINSAFWANPVGGHQTVFLIKGPEALIEISDDVGMSNVIIAARQRISLGQGVWLGGGVKIFDTDFHSLVYEERVADIAIPTAPVRIEPRCFIGADAIILKGVTIGERSIVGAGAVVAKSIPPGEIWAGNPARFIKKL